MDQINQNCKLIKCWWNCYLQNPDRVFLQFSRQLRILSQVLHRGRSEVTKECQRLRIFFKESKKRFGHTSMHHIIWKIYHNFKLRCVCVCLHSICISDMKRSVLLNATLNQSYKLWYRHQVLFCITELLVSISLTFYEQILFTNTDPKRAKNTVKPSVFVSLLGSSRIKALRKMLMKLTSEH